MEKQQAGGFNGDSPLVCVYIQDAGEGRRM